MLGASRRVAPVPTGRPRLDALECALSPHLDGRSYRSLSGPKEAYHLRILPPQVFSPVTSVKMRLLPPPPLWLVTDPIMQ
jgi:hypothetical protein